MQFSLELPMKFFLWPLSAQNGLVNNQNHKHSRSGCENQTVTLFTTSQPFHIQKLPRHFRLTRRNISILFASFWKWHLMHWRFASYTRNPLWHYQHSKLKNMASPNIFRLIPRLFENHTFCAFASCTRDYIFFCSRTSRKTTSAACLVGLFFLFFFQLKVDEKESCLNNLNCETARRFCSGNQSPLSSPTASLWSFNLWQISWWMDVTQ